MDDINDIQKVLVSLQPSNIVLRYVLRRSPRFHTVSAQHYDTLHVPILSQSLQWTFGLNKDEKGTVHNLSDGKRKVSPPTRYHIPWTH